MTYFCGEDDQLFPKNDLQPSFSSYNKDKRDSAELDSITTGRYFYALSRNIL